MKKVIYPLLILFCIIAESCENVIDVDLPQTDERLVIDGLIRISGEKNSDLVLIKLTKTASFYAQEVPIVADAKVEMRTPDQTYTLEFVDAGFYTAEIPRKKLTNETFQLHINYQNEEYEGSATMIPTPPLDSLTQGDGSLFTGDEKEIIISYTDPAPSRNYYLFDLDYGFYFVSEDTFYQGNPFSFSYFYDDLEAGDRVKINIIGVDKDFYDYLNIVITQTGQDAGSPFEPWYAAICRI